MATTKASGLTARNTSSLRKASELFANAEGNKYEAWFLVYEDFVASGIKSPEKYAEALSKNDIITTKMPVAMTEKTLGAIRRCVAKYGTVAKVKTAHAKWVKDNEYKYADITNLREFAPAGQRAKADANKPKAKLSARTVTARDIHTDLAYLPKAMREDIIAKLGLK